MSIKCDRCPQLLFCGPDDAGFPDRSTADSAAYQAYWALDFEGGHTCPECWQKQKAA